MKIRSYHLQNFTIIFFGILKRHEFQLWPQKLVAFEFAIRDKLE